MEVMVERAGDRVGDKVGGNQTQVPVIQTSNGDMTQFQQNTNKVLRNLNNSIVDIQTFQTQNTIIGEIKIANLIQTMFQAVAGDTWLLCNGQSCVDTAYSKLTGLNVVPTLTVGGFNTFIRVN